MILGAGEMVQKLGALAVFPEDLGSIPSSFMAVTPVTWGSLAPDMHREHRDMHGSKIPIQV